MRTHLLAAKFARRPIVALATAALCATSVLAPLTARAEPLEFVFSTTLDATDYGLSATEPVEVRFYYDPSDMPFIADLGMPAVRTLYGPIETRLRVGGDTVVIDAQLAIDDENSGHDSFSLDAAGYLVGTSLSGDINGVDVYTFGLYFLEQSLPLTMFSSRAAPSTTAFASAATLIRVGFSEYYGPANATRDFAPANFGNFVFSVPEPSSAASAFASLAALAAAASRRRSASPMRRRR